LPRGPKGGGGGAAAGGDQGGGLHWPLHELITSFVVDRTDGEIQYEPSRAGGWLVAGGPMELALPSMCGCGCASFPDQRISLCVNGTKPYILLCLCVFLCERAKIL